METLRRPAPRMINAWSLTAIAAAILLFAAFDGYRPDRLWGDEPTYVAMATSLARDGDLRFTEADRSWVLERSPGALILQRAGQTLGYSKPIVYPLLAAPWVWAFGEGGMLICNFVLVAFALALAWDFLFRLGDRGTARATWLTFLVASPILPYLFWRMSESTQVALSLAGLVLTCRDLRRPSATPSQPPRPIDLRRIVAGGVFLGLLVSLRLPNAAVAAVPIVAWAVYRRPKVCLTLLGSIAGSLIAATAITVALTGAPNPYRAVRTSFDQRTGYPELGVSGPRAAPEIASENGTGPATAESADRFASDPATHRAYWRALPEWSRTAYATFYAFAGRHSGLLLYFPSLWILATALRRPDRLTLCLLVGAAGLLAFYLLWLPGNYFGGSTFVGNRYWLAGYPLVLVALPRLPSRRALAIGWVFVALLGGSALLGVVEARRAGRIDSQAHVRRGVFRWLPAESSAAAIDGWTSRRWSGDELRFVDPHAGLEERGFRLVAGGRPAEVLLAHEAPAEPLFAVRADTAGVVQIRDWLGRRAEALDPGRAVLIPFRPAPPWRRHPTTSESPQRIVGLEFQFEADSGTAEVRYLGPGTERKTARRVRRATVPVTGFADSASDAWIGVQNHSTWTWASDGVLPVHLRYRFEAIAAGRTVAGLALALPARIEPGATLRMPFELQWPHEPGHYALTIDLEEEFFGPFAERVGEPLVRRTVTVGPSQTPPTPSTG